MIGASNAATANVVMLLDAQHKALLAGDLTTLGKMEDDLQQAFKRLERDGGPHEVLSQIKEAAARNARLVIAAQAGVAQVQALLSSARSPDLTTYDAQGRARVSAASQSRDLARR